MCLSSLGEQEEVMRRIALSLLLVAVMAAGCANAPNTLAQDLAWERWEVCDHFAAMTLERIDLDGRLVVTGYEHEAASFTTCVREAAADQARRGVSAGLTAAVLVKLYGCQGGAM
jgi:CTP:molybdopterin cytidylyltransferase MocA